MSDSERNQRAITKLFANLVKIASKHYKSLPASSGDAGPEAFPNTIVLLIDDDKAFAGRDPRSRAQASCEHVRGKSRVYVSQKLVDAGSDEGGVDRWAGVLAHELGHVYLLQRGVEEHTERQADEIAECLFGFTIKYDGEDVQTAGEGKSPRPKYLHNPADVAAPAGWNTRAPLVQRDIPAPRQRIEPVSVVIDLAAERRRRQR